MRVFNIILVFLVAASFLSCKDEQTSVSPEKDILSESELNAVKQERISCTPAELIKWVEDPENHMRQEKAIGEIVYSLQYRPSTYIVCKEGGTGLSPDSLKKKADAINDLQYYNFRIKIEDFSNEFLRFNMGSSSSYEERVKYFSFDMQRDLKMVEGKDTIFCALFHYERNYDITPYGNFLVAFPNDPANQAKNRTFIYKDRFLGSGIVKFTFTASDINHEPILSL